MRLGLCCGFRNAPIRFRTTTAAVIQRLPRPAQLARLAELVRMNALALQSAIDYCRRHHIAAFRVNSQILPLRTHPRVGYETAELPGSAELVALFQDCGAAAAAAGIRLTLHPDQFVVLNSPDPAVVRNSVAELAYQAEVAEWIGADVLTIHGGGGYGDKRAALGRLRQQLGILAPPVRARIALENDDRTFAPADLLPLCEATGTPFVYDVHHHRCLADGLSIAAVTARALHTWRREPLFHVSSPATGWRWGDPRVHHDHVLTRDFPVEWLELDVTVDVEARAKEAAVLRLGRALERRRPPAERRTPSLRPSGGP